MAPIKIGFIGLSSSQSWAVWAHLPYLVSSSSYQIVALCNSSVSSAQAAIKAHNLSPSTKAYGSPEDLAADPDVDLVVCSVRVDKHYEVLMPAIRAGKDVFCEWPLAKDAAQAKEMVALAKEKGVKTVVGLQGWQSPALKKIKQTIDEGGIGKVVSSTFHGTSKLFGGTVLDSLAYQSDRSVGGNLVTIYGMHSLEGIQSVLGPLESYSPLLAIEHPTIQLINHGGEPTTTMERTSHDHFFLNGTLASGAVLSYSLHGQPPFDGTSGSFWRIYGTKGAIQITGGDSYLQIADENLTIKLHEYAKDGLQDITFDKDDVNHNAIPLFARNVARLYEAFAKGKGVDEGVLDWDEALKRHEFVDAVYEKAGV